MLLLETWWNITPKSALPIAHLIVSLYIYATIYNAKFKETVNAFLQIITIIFIGHECIMFKIIVKIF